MDTVEGTSTMDRSLVLPNTLAQTERNDTSATNEWPVWVVKNIRKSGTAPDPI